MTSNSKQQTETDDILYRQLNKMSFTASFTALGWASLLLALSSASAFSTAGPRTDASYIVRRAGIHNPGPEVLENSQLFAHSSGNTKTYGFTNGTGDSAQPSRVNKFHPRSFATGTRTHGVERNAASTRLGYRDGDESDSHARQDEHDGAAGSLKTALLSNWWSKLHPTQSQTPEQKDQQVVDEYLEFLGRRYNRLHEDEKRQSSKKFSVLSWLTSNDEVVTQQQQEDALYVLGVAELASERLLQKHAIQPKTTKKSQGMVIDAIFEGPASTDVRPKAGLFKASRAMLISNVGEVGSSVLKRIAMHRRALIAYQDKQLRMAIAFVSKMLTKGPVKVAETLLKIGGGKKNLALTMTAFATVFLLIRPVASAMITESSYRI